MNGGLGPYHVSHLMLCIVGRKRYPGMAEIARSKGMICMGSKNAYRWMLKEVVSALASKNIEVPYKSTQGGQRSARLSSIRKLDQVSFIRQFGFALKRAVTHGLFLNKLWNYGARDAGKGSIKSDPAGHARKFV